MKPREILLEHIRFWTSAECPPLAVEDMELVQKIGEIIGVKIGVRSQMVIVEDQRVAR